MTPHEAVVAIENAGTALDAWSVGSYRELSLLLHPDRFGREVDWAKRAEQAKFKLDAFHTGKNPKPVSSPVVIGKWVVTGPLAKGDIADLHLAENTDSGAKAVLKIAQSPRDNDLIVAERESLEKLAVAGEKEQFLKYVPSLLDGFRASGKEVNVLSYHPAHVRLSDILSMVNPPLDFRHVVWMINRALSVLGFAHRMGVIHGAINPDHLLYDPGDHGLKLVDWCYSSGGDPIKAAVSKYKDRYAPEVLRKMKPSPATDLFMLATCFTDAIPIIHIPRRFHAIFDRCTAGSPLSRPRDAWQLQDDWMAAARDEYGEPMFINLEFPVH